MREPDGKYRPKYTIKMAMKNGERVANGWHDTAGRPA